MFDTLGNLLNDIVQDSTNNTVGWAHEQLFPKGFSEGGVVEEGGIGDYIKGIGSAAKSTMSSDKNDPLGAGFYHSPAHIAQSMTNLGKFFHVANTNEMNSNRFAKDQDQSKVPAATDPGEFYAKFYMSMRRFAEASEIAQRGQQQVRGP